MRIILRKYRHIVVVIVFLAVAIAVWYMPICASGEKLNDRAELQYDKKNFRIAFRLFERAAKKGSFAAKNNIGVMLLRGNGIARNYDLAMKCFHDAAENNIIIANRNLGAMYALGLGVNVDHEKAYKYYKIAADNGEYIAKLVVSTCYHNDGTFKNNKLLCNTEMNR